MESKLKKKVSRMFNSSFGSCRQKNLNDISETPIFITKNRRDFQKIEPLSPPKVRPFPSICRPKVEELMEENCGFEVLQRKKITERSSCFINGEAEGRTCPPGSPSSPSNFFTNFQDFDQTRERSKKNPKKVVKKLRKKKKNKKKMSSRLSSSSDNFGWFSSEDDDQIDDETETFFSSRSFSSDSSESLRRNSGRKRGESRRKRSAVVEKTEKGSRIEESFAVVKRSSDPQSDFRTSMVEMIIEQQIFAAKDLEKLLQCFLSLNSSHHHRVIIQVFTEIWDALFSNRF